MNFKKWNKIFIIEVLVALILAITFVVIIDPFFHFHKPVQGLYYTLTNERYVNNGILRHFEYDAVITGTSMTENFKTSEAQKVFGGNPVKVPFSGGSFKEMNDNIASAYKYGHQLKYVIRALDSYNLTKPANDMRNDLGTYPTYLYNDYLWDDFFYIFNKDAVNLCFKTLKETIKKGHGGFTDFDEYANWNAHYTFDAETVLGKRREFHKPEKIAVLSSKEKENLRENIWKNVVALAENHPETTFYYFFPPYSIVYWGSAYENGQIKKNIEAERLAIEMILECPNIKLYSFNLLTDITTDLSNYKDSIHYGEWVNDMILHWMKQDIGRLTKDNYQDYLEKEYQYYDNYQYNKVFEQLKKK